MFRWFRRKKSDNVYLPTLENMSTGIKSAHVVTKSEQIRNWLPYFVQEGHVNTVRRGAYADVARLLGAAPSHVRAVAVQAGYQVARKPKDSPSVEGGCADAMVPTDGS